MKKQFFAAALILALGAGFTACSNDDLSKSEGKEVAQNGTAFMSVSFTLPAPATTRAEADPARYQYGKWNGQDKIKSVKVYVFQTEGGATTLEKMGELADAQVRLDQKATGDVKVSANEAFKVKPGDKTVYVVVNPTASVNLPETVGGTLDAFETAYKKVNAGTDATKAKYFPTADVTETRASEVASVEGNDDVILMTGEKTTINVVDGVTQ